jgi:hypothetical protein
MHRDPRSERETVVTDTQAKQGNKKTTNFRVLAISLLLAVIVGTALITGFWTSTPNELESPLGSQPSQTAPTPAPETTAPATPGTDTATPEPAPENPSQPPQPAPAPTP